MLSALLLIPDKQFMRAAHSDTHVISYEMMALTVHMQPPTLSIELALTL